MSDKTLYNEKSIESLSPLEFTRLRPGVYAGSTEYSTQLVVEIESNSLDEVRLNHGDKIEITINKDNSIAVRDYGQGFIYSMREDGKSILEAAFSVLNTSGKFNSDGVYEGTALGLNGIGSKLTNFLSHWCNVTSYRDGHQERVEFVEGVFKNRVYTSSNAPSGTLVEWMPSEEFFEHVEPDINELKKLFKAHVCLIPGLTITLDNKGEKTIFQAKNGLNDLADEATKGKEIIKNRFTTQFKDGKYDLDLLLTYTNNHSLTIIPYVNIGLTDSGPHIVQIKTLLTREFNKFFREKGYLKEKDENLSGEDIQEGMFLVFNITAPGVSYDAQTKSRIVKLDMKPFTSALAENLQFWLSANEKEIKVIAEKALVARKAREAARKARDAARGVKPEKKQTLKAKMALSEKFTDCVNKDPKNRHLLLVEGESAAGSAIEARNTKTDAIYQLRGKTISPLKQSVDKILANQEMSDIIRIIGAGFGKDFDLSKCQFDKIVITSDADSDGADIELLLTTFFFTYMRPLVEAGKLYRAVTPLYIVTYRGKEEYLFTEEEMDEYRKSHTGSFEVLRAKGLGELDPEDLQKVCFKDQRFKRITVSDAAAAEKLLEILMGSAVDPRKKYIYDNATTLGFEFD